jgi:hypothetical protein
MDARVKQLKTPESCGRFMQNVIVKQSDLAQVARRRSVELRDSAYGAQGEIKKEALQAIYAYKEVLSTKLGRRTRASRTWQMTERHGSIFVP